MRLINVNTYAIQEFFDGCIPEYAILSHTWGEEEVTFQDMQHLNAKVEAKLGFKKIEATCQQAQRDRLDWAWVDTCCIDKTSSAELSEAINSMFQWYAKSKICYAFLADATNSSDMLKSRWFRRGWTLQELLAPSEVIFYSAQWSVLGHKTSVVTGFHGLLLEASGIPSEHGEVLTHFDPRDWTIAEKMTWASKRQTTRVEDIAYCLLGIFSVNIPLLYGEGERAFTRLQEEIMRISNDQSLFAWADEDAIPELPCGFLARRPANFVVRPHPVPDLYSDKPFKERRNRYDETAPAYSMSNRGIHIQLFLIPLSPEEPTTFYALLGNTSPSPDLPVRLAIIVRRVVERSFYRIQADKLFVVPELGALLYGPERWFGNGKPEELILRQIAPPLTSLHMPKAGTTTLWVDFSQLVAPSGTARLVPQPEGARVADTSVIYVDWKGHPITLAFEWLDNNFILNIDHDGSCILTRIGLPLRRPYQLRALEGVSEILLWEDAYGVRVIRAQSSLNSWGEGGVVHCVALHSLGFKNWDQLCLSYMDKFLVIPVFFVWVYSRLGDGPNRGIVIAALIILCIVLQGSMTFEMAYRDQTKPGLVLENETTRRKRN